LPGWRFSPLSINLGDSSDLAVESAATANVGRYGKQLDHLAEALEVFIDHLNLLDSDLAAGKKDILKVFLGDVAAVRKLKSRLRLGRAAVS